MSLWIPARELSITWAHEPIYWKWTHHDSCSSEVAELLNVCWLELSGRVDTKNLQVKTSYSAYLVYKLKDSSKNLEKANASVKTLHKEITQTVYIIDDDNIDDPLASKPHLRSDDWSEVKLGEFFNGSRDDGHVDMMLFERDDGWWKSGLIVRGIDVRPNNNNNNNKPDAVISSNIWYDCPEY
ncbi:hypothetical protein ACP275_14G305700 [Erythranthe tilingii]